MIKQNKEKWKLAWMKVVQNATHKKVANENLNLHNTMLLLKQLFMGMCFKKRRY
jgi:hypothetical protein